MNKSDGLKDLEKELHDIIQGNLGSLMEGRDPRTLKLLTFFLGWHLPPHLEEISAESMGLAFSMMKQLPDGPELTAGLRKLLEAKDCFVRAALELRFDAAEVNGENG